MKRSLLSVAVVLAVFACAPTQRADAVDLVMTSRTVPLSGKLTLATAEKAAAKLVELDGISGDPIFLTINAQGDGIEAAFAVIDTIRALRSPVVAVVQSRAYDAVAVLAVLCEKTYAYPNAVFLFAPVDKVSTEIKPSKEPSEAFLKQFQGDVYGLVAKAISTSPEAFAEKVKDGWWLTAEQALDAKIVDGLVDTLTTQELYLEKTEIKTTVTTIEERQIKQPDGKKPGGKKPGGKKPGGKR